MKAIKKDKDAAKALRKETRRWLKKHLRLSLDKTDQPSVCLQ